MRRAAAKVREVSITRRPSSSSSSSSGQPGQVVVWQRRGQRPEMELAGNAVPAAGYVGRQVLHVAGGCKKVSQDLCSMFRGSPGGHDLQCPGRVCR